MTFLGPKPSFKLHPLVMRFESIVATASSPHASGTVMLNCVGCHWPSQSRIWFRRCYCGGYMSTQNCVAVGVTWYTERKFRIHWATHALSAAFQQKRLIVCDPCFQGQVHLPRTLYSIRKGWRPPTDNKFFVFLETWWMEDRPTFRQDIQAPISLWKTPLSTPKWIYCVLAQNYHLPIASTSVESRLPLCNRPTVFFVCIW